MVAFPLLIIPLAIYNMIAFLTPPDGGWSTKVLVVGLASGETWTLTFGDALVGLALLMLLFEVLKAVRPGTRTVIDHLLSTLVLAGAVAEFVMVKQAATSTFAILCGICLVDVIGGIGITIRAARRARAIERVEPTHPAPEPIRHEPDVFHPASDASHPTP